MPAAQNDKFLYVGTPGTATTLGGAGYTIGGTSITVTTTTNWPTATGVVFGIDTVTVNAAGVETRVEGSYCVFSGVVTNGTTISSLVLEFGTPQNYLAGATTRVYITVSSIHNKRLIEGLLVGLNQDGTHKAFTETAIVPTVSLQDNAVTTAKVADSAVTATKLATGAITLGYAQSTTGFNNSNTFATDITGLTIEVTVPAGGRRLKITGFVSNISNASGTANATDILIREGTTVLSFARGNTPTSSATYIGVAMYSAVVTAGAHTYRLSTKNDVSANVLLNAAVNAPSFILVELI